MTTRIFVVKEQIMVYLVSFVVYMAILGFGIIIIQKSLIHYERHIIKLTLFGFAIQLFINWSSLGNLSAMPQLTLLNRANNSNIELMILTLISIFCYASLLVIFFKAHDYYFSKK